MNLLKNLQQLYGASYLLIAHNLATVRYMSHQVVVMYLGKIVEKGPTRELFTNPMRPYAKALIAASLPAHPDQQREDLVLSSEVPSPLEPPTNCAFHPRCPFVMDRCSQHVPEFKDFDNGHRSSCHMYWSGHYLPTAMYGGEDKLVPGSGTDFKHYSWWKSPLKLDCASTDDVHLNFTIWLYAKIFCVILWSQLGGISCLVPL